jgi:hypothetical protein
MEWDAGSIIWIIFTVILILTTAFGGVKWQQTKKLARETGEALIATADALEDDKLDEEERKAIAKEWSEVITAAKTLFNRRE